MATDLCLTFNALAEETWAQMDFGFHHGYGRPDERAFTDHHLIELSRRHPIEVRSAKVSQNREAETGADFEWWLGDGQSYLAMWVQAKKLDLHSDCYPELGKKAGRSGERQIDRLIRLARAERFLPLYLFFNGPPAAGAWPQDQCANPNLAPDHRGCTLALAAAVRERFDRAADAALAALAPTTWPWQCLSCCPAVRGDNPGARALTLFGAAGAALADEPGAVLSDQLPAYVQRLAEGDAPGELVIEPGEGLPGSGTLLVMTAPAAD